MALLAATFNRELTDVLISAYYVTLEQLDAVDFEAGVREVLRTERFWPAPAVILQAAEEARSQRIRRAAEEQERLEWQEAQARLAVLQRRPSRHAPSLNRSRVCQLPGQAGRHSAVCALARGQRARSGSRSG
jgi:hypothetical protein